MRPVRFLTVLATGFCLALLAVSILVSQTAPPANPSTSKATPMTHRASGSFEVKLVPQAPDEAAGTAAIGRMLLDKQFHGDLEATSKGQMLAHSTSEQGSAGYVALEEVTGTLGGRTGTFVLLHSGLMNRGTPRLSITVVPDSGTGSLKGLTGTMDIQIEGGKHSYVFEYSLPDAP